MRRGKSVKKEFLWTDHSLPSPTSFAARGVGREGVVEESQTEGVKLNLGSQVKSVLPVTVAGK